MFAAGTDGNAYTYNWESKKWSKVTGVSNAVRIDVASYNLFAIVDSNGLIYANIPVKDQILTSPEDD